MLKKNIEPRNLLALYKVLHRTSRVLAHSDPRKQKILETFMKFTKTTETASMSVHRKFLYSSLKVQVKWVEPIKKFNHNEVNKLQILRRVKKETSNKFC